MGLSLIHIIALSLVPAVSATMLNKLEEKPQPVFNKILDRYSALLSRALDKKAFLLIAVVALLALGAFGATRMGTAFIPESDTTEISVTLQTPNESTVKETREMADTVSNLISQIPDVKTVGAMQTGDSNSISFYVVLKSDRENTSMEVSQMILDATQELDCDVSVSGGMAMSSLGGSGIQINIKGDDLDQLKKISSDIAGIVADVPGTMEVSDGTETAAPEIRITVDKNKAMSYLSLIHISSANTPPATAKAVTAPPASKRRRNSARSPSLICRC